MVEGTTQKLLEKELHDLDKQRIEVEHRLRELEAKERSQMGRSSGRDRFVGAKRLRDEGLGGRPHGDDFRGRSRQDAFFPNKKRFMDDEREPKVTSMVVKVNERDPEKPQPSLNVNEADKKRHRKMFGFLLGTLQQFKKDVEVKSEAETKRHEIDQKIENKMEQERTDLLAQHQKILNEQKEREIKLKEEIKKKQEETELAILEQKWAKHHALLNLFRKTKAKPPVHFAFNPRAPPLIEPATSDEGSRLKLENEKKVKNDTDIDGGASSGSEQEGDDNRDKIV